MNQQDRSGIGLRRWALAPLAIAVSSLAIGSGQGAGTEEREMAQAGQPLNPLTTAGRLAAVPLASALGDEETARTQFNAAHADLMRSMKVADARRPIDRESARTVARQVPGVRSVVWVDRHNLLAMVCWSANHSVISKLMAKERLSKLTLPMEAIWSSISTTF